MKKNILFCFLIALLLLSKSTFGAAGDTALIAQNQSTSISLEGFKSTDSIL